MIKSVKIFTNQDKESLAIEEKLEESLLKMVLTL